MAQRAIVALIRRAISCYVEESELEAQVLQGQVRLTRLKLWPRTLCKGLSCSGCVGELHATWSWSSLLSSPVSVEISNVVVVVQPEHLLGDWERRWPSQQPDPPDASSQTFLKRLKRRVMDQLRVQVTNFHCRLELPLEDADAAWAGQWATPKVNKPGPWYGVALGFSWGKLRTIGNPSNDGVHVEQTVQVDDAGVYFELLSSKLEAQPLKSLYRSRSSGRAPPSSPSSSPTSSPTARRHASADCLPAHSPSKQSSSSSLSGHLTPPRPRESHRRRQARSSSSRPSKQVPLAFDSFEAFTKKVLPNRNKFIAMDLSPTCTAKRRCGQPLTDWRDVELRIGLHEPQFMLTAEHFTHWPKLLRALKNGVVLHRAESTMSSGGSEDEFFDALEDFSFEYFDTVSPEDRKLLLADDEEQGPAEGTLQLEVSLQCVSVSFKESLLRFGFGCDCSLTLHAKGWEGEGRLNEVLLSDTTRETEADSWELCVARKSPDDVALAVINARSNADPMYSLMLHPMDVCLPPALLEALSGPLPQHNWGTDSKEEPCSRASSGRFGDESSMSLSPGRYAPRRNLGHVWARLSEVLSSLQALRQDMAPPDADVPVGIGKKAMDVNLRSVSLVVGEPWLPGAQLIITMSGAGRFHSDGRCSLSGSTALFLDDEGCCPLLEATEVSFTRHGDQAKEPSKIHCGPVTVTCAVHKLVALMRACKVCVTGFRQSFKTSERRLVTPRTSPPPLPMDCRRVASASTSTAQFAPKPEHRERRRRSSIAGLTPDERRDELRRTSLSTIATGDATPSTRGDDTHSSSGGGTRRLSMSSIGTCGDMGRGSAPLNSIGSGNMQMGKVLSGPMTTSAGAETSTVLGASKIWLQVFVERLMLRIDDEDCSGQYHMQIEPLHANIHRSGASLDTRCCDLKICINGEAQGLLRVTRGTVKWVQQKGEGYWSHKCDMAGAIEVHDSERCNVAVFCPTLAVSFSLDKFGRGTSKATPVLKMNVSVREVDLDTLEAFMNCIKKAVRRASDIMSSLSVNAVVMEERPFGLLVEDSRILDATGSAANQGLVPGSTIVTTDPPSDAGIPEFLQTSTTPVVLVVKPPPFSFIADVSVTPWVLHMTSYTSRIPVQLRLHKTEVTFAAMDLTNWRGTPGALSDEVSSFYKRAMIRKVPALAVKASVNTDGTVAGTVNGSLKVGGAVAGAAAGAMANKTAAALASSKAMGGDIVNRFGGVTRSFLQLRMENQCEEAEPLRNRYDDRSKAGGGDKQKAGSLVTKVFRRCRTDPTQIRRTLDDGPVLTRANSLDSARLSNYSQSSGLGLQSEAEPEAPAASLEALPPESPKVISRDRTAVPRSGSRATTIPSMSPYQQFSCIVAAGKEARGVEVDDNYKFGDFSRGLLAKMRRRSQV